jgi:hypothetical protein
MKQRFCHKERFPVGYKLIFMSYNCAEYSRTQLKMEWKSLVIGSVKIRTGILWNFLCNSLLEIFPATLRVLWTGWFGIPVCYIGQDPRNPLWRWVMKMYEFFGKNLKWYSWKVYPIHLLIFPDLHAAATSFPFSEQVRGVRRVRESGRGRGPLVWVLSSPGKVGRKGV